MLHIILMMPNRIMEFEPYKITLFAYLEQKTKVKHIL